MADKFGEESKVADFMPVFCSTHEEKGVLAFSCNGLNGIQDDSSKNKHASKPKRAIRKPQKTPKSPKPAR
jgi:hypothetical protein